MTDALFYVTHLDCKITGLSNCKTTGFVSQCMLCGLQRKMDVFADSGSTKPCSLRQQRARLLSCVLKGNKPHIKNTKPKETYSRLFFYTCRESHPLQGNKWKRVLSAGKMSKTVQEQRFMKSVWAQHRSYPWFPFPTVPMHSSRKVNAFPYITGCDRWLLLNL